MISNIAQPVEFLREWELFWLDGEEKNDEAEENERPC